MNRCNVMSAGDRGLRSCVTYGCHFHLGYSQQCWVRLALVFSVANRSNETSVKPVSNSTINVVAFPLPTNRGGGDFEADMLLKYMPEFESLPPGHNHSCHGGQPHHAGGLQEVHPGVSHPAREGAAAAQVHFADSGQVH